MGISLSVVKNAFPDMVVLPGEPLSRHTTFGVGGKCGFLCYPRSAAEAAALAAKISAADDEFLVLGGGSNVLVSDRGYSGAVIKTEKLDKISVAGGSVRAEAGVKLPFFAGVMKNRGLSGAEFLSGIPGTVGGAAAGNAGAFGRSFSDICESVEVADADGRIRVIPADECGFGYRESGIRGVVLAANLRLVPGDRAEISAIMEDYRARRERAQPKGRSAGSIFLAADGVPAGALIDEAGLKGLSLGGAKVSGKHANFILNVGGATAADICRLIRAVRLAVLGGTGVNLVPEIRYIGELP